MLFFIFFVDILLKNQTAHWDTSSGGEDREAYTFLNFSKGMDGGGKRTGPLLRAPAFRVIVFFLFLNITSLHTIHAWMHAWTDGPTARRIKKQTKKETRRRRLASKQPYAACTTHRAVRYYARGGKPADRQALREPPETWGSQSHIYTIGRHLFVLYVYVGWFSERANETYFCPPRISHYVRQRDVISKRANKQAKGQKHRAEDWLMGA